MASCSSPSAALLAARSIVDHRLETRSSTEIAFDADPLAASSSASSLTAIASARTSVIFGSVTSLARRAAAAPLPRLRRRLLRHAKVREDVRLREEVLEPRRRRHRGALLELAPLLGDRRLAPLALLAP
mmetsp:Transcript_18174/g.57088  ORF Transcript_18174/g.57088 Transcript_18174/m.57088 type:complete len:129 (+) Transcript_18174:1223-1609(+)